MNTGERLVQLAGRGGVAAALLLTIGSGATTGAALVNYSAGTSGTALERLMWDAPGARVYRNQIHVTTQLRSVFVLQRKDRTTVTKRV